ncbi:MAG: MBL fold metallo-hydrolase [Magnetococcales bacterium]|nr:MBL fold metallo-hydrolase [Magnetococcales bacterium]
MFRKSKLLILTIFIAGCAYNQLEQFGDLNPMYNTNGKRLMSHNVNGQFYNPKPKQQNMQKDSLWSSIYSWFFDRDKRKPPVSPVVHKLSSLSVGDGQTHITWMGHSTMLLEIDGKTLLIDPVFSDYAAPFSWLPPHSFFPEMPININNIKHIDAVVISHDHYDHLDYKTIKRLSEKAGQFIVPLGVGSHLRRWGVEDDKIIELDWWSNTKLGSITLTATPSQHFSGRSFTDKNKTLWAGWAVQGKSENIFFSGDSGYFSGFKQIGQRLGPFDLTMLECGAYNKAWPGIHMFPEQTAQAHLDLQGKALIPIHWGRFDLSLHTWDESIKRLKVAAKDKDITIVSPMIGQRFSMNTELPTTSWWYDIADK